MRPHQLKYEIEQWLPTLLEELQHLDGCLNRLAFASSHLDDCISQLPENTILPDTPSFQDCKQHSHYPHALILGGTLELTRSTRYVDRILKKYETHLEKNVVKRLDNLTRKPVVSGAHR